MLRRRKILLTSILCIALFFTLVSNTHTNTYATNDLESSNQLEEVSNKEASSHSELKKTIYQEMLNKNNTIKIKYYGDVDSSAAFNNMLEDIINELLDFDHYSMYTFTTINSKADYTYLQNPDGSEGKVHKPINVTIEVGYRTTLEQENYVTSRTNEILEQIIEDGMSDEAKVKAVHNYIVANVEYDQSLSKFTAYDALYEGKAVCQGYSLLAYKMLNKIGIPTRIISSAKMNHSWNLVKVNGQWYHMDLTWDDPTPDVEGRILENHLLLTDEQIIELDKDQNPPRSWEGSEYPNSGEGIVGTQNGEGENQFEEPEENEELKEFEQIAEVIYETDTGSETIEVKITADPGVIKENASFDIELLDSNDEEIRNLITELFIDQGSSIEELMIYDIFLKKGQEQESIDGRVLISISIPESFQQEEMPIKVFKINNDGLKADMSAKIINDNIEFATAYSGTYVIAIFTDDNAEADSDIFTVPIDDIDEHFQKIQKIKDNVKAYKRKKFLSDNEKTIKIILISAIVLIILGVIIRKKRKKPQDKHDNSQLDIYYNNGYKNFDDE